MAKRGIFYSIVGVLALGGVVAAGEDREVGVGVERPVYLDRSQPIDARVNDLLSRMNTDEKISLVHGNSKFSTAAIPRLGIPVRWTSDGPHGVREEISPDEWDSAGRTDDFSTAMPCGCALAATWDPDLATTEGWTIGSEALKRGKQIMLGPSINIQRTPLCGRNLEYFGEDPFLTGKMAVGYIRGVQSQGVASCVKHFAANNQEKQRMNINEIIDERTLREIYLPAFQAAVQEGGALSVMAAYNQINGVFSTENGHLLNEILKGEWGFKGLVMSDWAAVHSTRGPVLGGLDLEMGTDKPYDQYYMAGPYLAGLKTGKYPMAGLDDKVRRNLYVMFATGAYDGTQAPGAINTVAHQMTARNVEEEAMVLLKNENALLPLDAGKVKSIAVIGLNATQKQTHGGDSSAIKAFYEITPLEGIVDLVGRTATVSYCQGYAPRPLPKSAGYATPPGPDTAKPAADAEELMDRAVAAAKAADVAIVVGGNDHSHIGDTEGWDRPSMDLPYGQDELIRRVIAANPRTIVVIVGGSPVAMPWVKEAPAIVQAWFGGMEAGNAIARVLFGQVNPSGKLPCTFPKQLADSPAHAMGNYPGQNGVVKYEEGILVGYRWYDSKGIEPLFPFGFGLSYTKFDYSDLSVEKSGDEVNVKFTITNSGGRRGADIAQVYVHEEKPQLMRPEKELKGFIKVALNPGESRTVSIPLGQRAFAYFDPARGWVAQADDFSILVGASSRDIRLKGNVQRDQTLVQKF